MFVVGLTGGIGSGKSTVSALFQQLGAAIVDTDVIAHQLTAPQGKAIAAIGQAFGSEVLTETGGLDRAAMRELVFRDVALRHRLEQILHPMIWEQAQQEITTSTAPYVIVVVPLLIESGHWKERVDRIIVVDCPEQQQIERAMARSRLSREQVEAIMAAQVPRAAKRAAADDIIDNSGDPDALKQCVTHLHQCYLVYAEKFR